MTRRLLAGYLGIVLLVLVVHDIPLALTLRRVERDRLVTALERDAFTIAGRAEETLEDPATPSATLVSLIASYSARTGARVVVTDDIGLAVASSDPDTTVQRDYSTRPEIAAALAGEVSSGTRESATLGTDLFYVAVPVISGDRILGTVRLTYPANEVDGRIRDRLWGLLAAALITLAVAAAVGYVLARSLNRPVRDLRAATGAVAAGDLAARVPDDEGPPALRDLASSFNTMAEQLDHMVHTQRAFAGDASHELRTPLTALRLRLEQATELVERGDAAAALPALEAATDETYRLGRLVEGLLVLSRAGVEGTPREPVDLARVARARVETWAPLYDERGVELNVDVPDTLPTQAIVGAVDQVVDNYLANALEAVPQGGRVVVRAGRVSGAHGPNVELHVLDDGPGLDDAELARVFDRFWRATDAPAGGTGLGLAIARELARASGGDAELRRRPEGGIDAVLRLPAR